MLSSATPTKIALPFAASGSKRTIPVASQIGITNGAASFTDGFPPLTFLPLASGGIPPAGQDFNGIFNAITAIEQWQSAGGYFTYDAALSTAIGGYPKGAKLLRSDLTGSWFSTVDNNTSNPDAGGANWEMRDVGQFTGYTSVTSNRNLTVGDMGKAIFATTGPFTLTLPTPTSLGLINGQAFVLFTTSAPVSIAAGSGATINYDTTVSGSFSLKSGQSLTCIVSSGTSWQITNSTAGLERNFDFSGNLTVPGYQRTPGGRIEFWGSATTNGSGVATFTYPFAFASGVLDCQCTYVGGSLTPNRFLNRGIIGLGSTSAYMCDGTGAAISGAGVDFRVLGV